MPDRDLLELNPKDGTLSAGSEEGRVLLYESSVRRYGERLLTLRTFGRGMRLTPAQARELHDWIGVWLDA
jgi:hypothetical protein